eukprot:s750_g41.t1
MSASASDTMDSSTFGKAWWVFVCVLVLFAPAIAAHPSLLAGLELLQLWDEAKRRPDSEELRRAVRGFNSFHRECFRAGLAYVIDPASEKWRSCKPFGRDKELPSFLKVDCLCVRAFNPFYPPREEDRAALAKERAAHLNRLCPIPELQRRVWQLPRGTVSVHIRRTDHAKAIARSPEELFWHTMETYPQDVLFFLATDDPDVEERMKSRFGSRLLTAPKSLNRNSRTGIQDALIDLLMLSQGIEVLGSFKSSFSAMASHFHMVPLRTMDISPTPAKPGAAFREVTVVPLDPEDHPKTQKDWGMNGFATCQPGVHGQPAEHSGRGWSPDQATETPNARAPLRGVRRALAEVEIDLEESDKEEGFSDYYDEDEEEVSDDEGRSSRFGLQFERVVPESAYSVSADDGLLVEQSNTRNTRDYELEEVIADRWWSRLRRRFFRHNYRAYGLVEGQWQRVPDPRGPRYKPRKRHRSRLQKKEEKMKREMQSRSPR